MLNFTRTTFVSIQNFKIQLPLNKNEKLSIREMLLIKLGFFFFLFIRFTCNTLKKLCIYTFHQIIKY